jgi:KDO2-lipid IV(A) lauroyltransferase
MSERASLTAYRFAWRLVRAMPERLAYLTFSALAQLAWLAQGRGVRQLEANLGRAVPSAGAVALKHLSRKGMHSYMRYWCDAFRLPGWSQERILATCRAEGDGPVRATLAQGRGVVMALAHQGNWDHAGAWSTLALAKVTTVAERQDRHPELLAELQELLVQLLRPQPLGDSRDLGQS